MPVPITIPKATITMEEAQLLSWVKAEGDRVAKDDPLFEMETDKAVMEVPALDDGVLLKIVTSSGSVRPDQVVGWLGNAGEQIEAAPAPVKNRIAASPAARRRALELSVDLASVTGTGPDGRIIQEDVERTAPATPAIDLSRRKTLIQRLTATWRSVPHFHVARKIDAEPLLRRQAGVSITDLLLYALARLLPRHPALCHVWTGETLTAATGMHLSFAVDAERGVIAPVIRDAGRLSIAALSTERKRLAELARLGRLSAADLDGGVFTLTNLGTAGVDFFTPVIHHPQTAILATGRIVQEPVVADGVIGMGSRMWLNLAVDHRVADGAPAGRFLSDFETNLKDLLPTQED